MLLSIILSFIFIILGLIHINWVFGGQFGFENSLPTKENGERVLNPKKIDSAIVGISLIFFGVFYLNKAILFTGILSQNMMNYAGWIIPFIFILRAIGDFRYIGFFKRIKMTAFGKLDTKFFSPLCLIIGILGLIIQILN